MTTSVLGHMAGENAVRLLQTLPEVRSDLSDAGSPPAGRPCSRLWARKALRPRKCWTSHPENGLPLRVSIL